MYHLYSVLFSGLLVFGFPYLLYRSLREKGYARSLRERFGLTELAAPNAPSIWVHAVSVGEVLAVATLLPSLKKAFPDTPVVVSVITVTGRQVAADKLAGVDAVFYCPFDFAFLVRRVVARMRPLALVVMETELWPHLLRECHRAGAVTMIANGRISDGSFPRYEAIAGVMKHYLEQVDMFCMQDELYAERIAILGAPASKIKRTGSLKFDALPQASSRDGRVLPDGRRILVGGSTLAGEEEALLSIFESLRKDYPDLFLVIAPRHAPRFDDVYELARGRDLRIARRSTPDAMPADTDVLILDTLGELASLYREADYVFVGGSLANEGGHNIIEPASEGKPVLFGPHMQNFADIARSFLEAEAVLQVEDAAALEAALRDLIESPDRARILGERARRVVEEQRGASERTVNVLKELFA